MLAHLCCPPQERFGDEVLARVQKLGQVPMTVKNDSGQTVKWLLTKKAIEERLSIDMEAAAKRISLSEVLTVHGKADATIPYQDGEAFSRLVLCFVCLLPASCCSSPLVEVEKAVPSPVLDGGASVHGCGQDCSY